MVIHYDTLLVFNSRRTLLFVNDECQVPTNQPLKTTKTDPSRLPDPRLTENRLDPTGVDPIVPVS